MTDEEKQPYTDKNAELKAIEEKQKKAGAEPESRNHRPSKRTKLGKRKVSTARNARDTVTECHPTSSRNILQNT